MKQEIPEEITEAFSLIQELHLALKLPPIKEMPDSLWAHAFGPWRFRINGSRETRELIPAFHAFVEYEGWPAGCFSPFAGSWFGLGPASEVAFCEQLKQHIAALTRGDSHGPGLSAP